MQLIAHVVANSGVTIENNIFITIYEIQTLQGRTTKPDRPTHYAPSNDITELVWLSFFLFLLNRFALFAAFYVVFGVVHFSLCVYLLGVSCHFICHIEK